MNICKCGIAAVDCDYHRPSSKLSDYAKDAPLPEGVPIIVDTTSGKPKVIDPASVDVWNPVTGLMETARAIDVGPLNWPRPMTIRCCSALMRSLRAAKIPEFDPGPPSSGAHATFDRATFDFAETETLHGALTPKTIARRAFVMTNCGTVQIDPCSRTGLVRIHLSFDPAVIILGPADFREFIEEARPAWLAFSITWGPAALKWD